MAQWQGHEQAGIPEGELPSNLDLKDRLRFVLAAPAFLTSSCKARNPLSDGCDAADGGVSTTDNADLSGARTQPRHYGPERTSVARALGIGRSGLVPEVPVPVVQQIDRKTAIASSPRPIADTFVRAPAEGEDFVHVGRYGRRACPAVGDDQAGAGLTELRGLDLEAFTGTKDPVACPHLQGLDSQRHWSEGFGSGDLIQHSCEPSAAQQTDQLLILAIPTLTWEREKVSDITCDCEIFISHGRQKSHQSKIYYAAGLLPRPFVAKETDGLLVTPYKLRDNFNTANDDPAKGPNPIHPTHQQLPNSNKTPDDELEAATNRPEHALRTFPADLEPGTRVLGWQLQAASQRLGIFGLNALQLAAASVPLLDGA
ncbi:hypothetical protein B0T24DRAFT_587134 [Lasiosphaeria ovina]|uniref:Uncharacterized protein n=1 Tax=Lasiosphaeria ovina TaxID=92902 RepID=A0AAE0TWS5_9PEZI|nr:hypothetical protein B0T24DRAFT_587134 [Lasiosphaeria ovina]